MYLSLFFSSFGNPPKIVLLLFYSSVFYLRNVFNPNCSSKSIAGFNNISLRPFKYEPYPGEIGQHEFGIAPIHAYNFVGFDLRVFNAAVNVKRILKEIECINKYIGLYGNLSNRVFQEKISASKFFYSNLTNCYQATELHIHVHVPT